MANVVDLPDHAKKRATSRKVARYLRAIADFIEADELETEPHAVLLILTGAEQHEVVYAGYGQDARGCDGAAHAAVAVVGAHFKTVGGNIRPRDHAFYGTPLRKQNIVDFAQPARRAATPPAEGDDG